MTLARSITASGPDVSIGDLPAVTRRAIRGWCMYDWANSAFATSGLVAIFPVYFVFLFRESLGSSVSVLGVTFTGSSVWGLAVAFSTAIVVVSSPALGVLSDRIPIKRLLLWTYTGVGSLFTMLAFFCAYTGQPWAWLIGAFTLANIGFAGSQIFYNAFLPHLAPRHLADAVSSRGYAFGYAGGGMLLLAHLALILATQDTDVADLATRIAIATVGLWWFGWSLWTFKTLPEPPLARVATGNGPNLIVVAFSELFQTFRQLRRFRVVLVYLGAFLLFNDGLQTIITIAGAFAADTLRIPLAFNMGTIVIIQFIAIPGALFFGRLADRFTTKSALTIALFGWIVIVLFGVSVAPLEPKSHQDFDIRIEYQDSAGRYAVTAAAESEDAGPESEVLTPADLLVGSTLLPDGLHSILRQAGDSPDYEYSISVSGGPLDGSVEIGAGHASSIGAGPVDFWPLLMRDLVWDRLGLNAGYQWLILGVLVGSVIGGSQALARSLYSQITPQSRSGEFFSFFGFMSRASAVFGPTLYIAATAAFDTRVAVTSILLIIVAGTVVLRWVDVEAGARVAVAVDARGATG
jgi:UMF1 family MFS transporter